MRWMTIGREVWRRHDDGDPTGPLICMAFDAETAKEIAFALRALHRLQETGWDPDVLEELRRTQ